MGSMRLDLGSRLHPEQIDHFDRLPESILLLIFNRVADVKALGRCCVVSRRFRALVPQVDDVIVRVDCVISDDDSFSPGHSSSSVSVLDRSRYPIVSIFRLLFSGLVKPLHSLITHLIVPSSGCQNASLDEDFECDSEQICVTHHSPTQVLRNFNEIKLLRIELPSAELGIDEGVLLKWKADFGSTLDSCVILGASSVTRTGNNMLHNHSCSSDVTEIDFGDDNGGGEMDYGSIPVSFYTNGGLKLRVVWTISSLVAASARHYLLQPIIAEHETLESLSLTDADGQGVLSMNKEQLQELRKKPLLASSASKRTLVPALNMWLWYAPRLELPCGMVLEGATLVAIRPSEHPKKEILGSEWNWVSSGLEEPFDIAAKIMQMAKVDASSPVVKVGGGAGEHTAENMRRVYEKLSVLVSGNAVVVFTVNGCFMCHVVKQLLFGLGVGPAVVELDRDSTGRDIQALLRSLAGGSARLQPIPAVFVGGKFLGGIESVMACHINGTLVPLLKEAGALWL
ncbi:F-box protein-like [Dorcoceras hygrometricum]|nr:F-box protein-like [Dorcoceras hygrometricum]